MQSPSHPAVVPAEYGHSRLKSWKILLSVALLMLTGVTIDVVEAGPEGRTRTFCNNIFTGGEQYACGGHLEPQCVSGSACDAGFNTYSGSPFPKTINCPSPISDEVVTAGCFDTVPTCADCSAEGQPPCPQDTANFCKVGCDAGLVLNTGNLRCEKPDTPGSLCISNADCGSGLSCDLLSQRCVAPADAGESCANPFVDCATGLSCTLALECSHAPARQGETCDVSNPCGDGLYCKAGFPQRCHPLRKPGEACGPAAPCMAGSQCEACLTDKCNAALQCVYNANQGAITEQGCRNIYSHALHNGARDAGLTMTYGGGNAVAAIVGESQEFGIAYSATDNRFGCYTSLCAGLDADVTIEHFFALGLYEEYDFVGGSSFANTQEAQLPGNLLNFATSQIFSREPDEVVPLSPALIGTADAIAIGVGPNILPFSAASMICETVLDTIPELADDQISTDTPPSPPPVESPEPGYGALRFDGDDDKLVIADSSALAALTMTAAFTLEAWISPDEESQDLSILSKEGEYQIGLLDGELAFTIANTHPGWEWTRSGFYPPVGRWTHIALVYADVAADFEQRVYINGDLIHRSLAMGAVGDHHPDSDEFHIGGRERYAATFSGLIDEVRIWSRALTHSEIRAELAALPNASAAGLVAGWSFDEQGGDLLSDAGPGQYDIALSGQGVAAAPAETVDFSSINRTRGPL